MSVYAGQFYKEDVKGAMIVTMTSNLKKVMEQTQHICLLQEDATDEQEEEIKLLMKDLRQSQSALKKSIDRKRQEIDKLRAAHNILLTAHRA